jgi:hypothetical protein
LAGNESSLPERIQRLPNFGQHCRRNQPQPSKLRLFARYRLGKQRALSIPEETFHEENKDEYD